MSLSWCCEPLIGSLCFLILFVEGGGGGWGTCVPSLNFKTRHFAYYRGSLAAFDI